MIFATPYLIGGAALVGALLAGGGVWKVMDWRCDAARVEAVERAVAQMERIQAQNDEIASRFEAERTRTITLYRDLEDTVNETDPPYLADCRFPAAWLWAWNTANKGQAAGPKPPQDPVPERTGAAAVGDAPGYGFEPHSLGTDVPRLPPEGGWLDRVGKGWFE